jgi:hypothetical protein
MFPTPLKADTCGMGRIGSTESGKVRIDELTATRVRGEANTSTYKGTFDLPVCNPPSGEAIPACGCAP